MKNICYEIGKLCKIATASFCMDSITTAMTKHETFLMNKIAEEHCLSQKSAPKLLKTIYCPLQFKLKADADKIFSSTGSNVMLSFTKGEATTLTLHCRRLKDVKTDHKSKEAPV